MAVSKLQYSYRQKLQVSETREIIFEWTIEDFLAKQPHMDERVYSEAFPAKTLPQWYIQIQPRGDAKDNEKFGVYLVLEEAEKDDFAVADYKIQFLNDSGTAIDCIKDPQEVFTEGIGSGYAIADDSDDPIPLSESGKLIIKATVTVSGKVSSDPYCFPYEIAESSLVEDLMEWLKSGEQADSTIETADGQVIPVNKGILSARSEVLAKMFNSGWKEGGENRVKLPFDREIVDSLVEFLYSDEVVNLTPTAARLYPVAHQYQLERLVGLCAADLIANLTVANISVALRIAKDFDDDKLLSTCKKFSDGHRSDAVEMVLAIAFNGDQSG